MWIREYRERMGLELDEFARVVNLYRQYDKQRVSGYVSNTLVHLLEADGHAITHPVLANAIATVCGATKAQRDSIIRAERRNTPYEAPDAHAKALVVRALKAVRGDAITRCNRDDDAQEPFYTARQVVKLDRMGNTVETYPTIYQTALDNGLAPSYVRRRCQRRIRQYGNMYTPGGYTFRYADEWDRMSQAEKLADIKAGH